MFSVGLFKHWIMQFDFSRANSTFNTVITSMESAVSEVMWQVIQTQVFEERSFDDLALRLVDAQHIERRDLAIAPNCTNSDQLALEGNIEEAVQNREPLLNFLGVHYLVNQVSACVEKLKQDLPQVKAAWEEKERTLGYHPECSEAENFTGFTYDLEKSHLQNYESFIEDLKWRVAHAFSSDEQPKGVGDALKIETYSDRQVFELQQFLLIERVKQYSSHEIDSNERAIPEELQGILKFEATLGKNLIVKLKKFVKARDTLIVWNSIIRAQRLYGNNESGVHLGNEISFENLSVNDFLEKEKLFNEWVNKNKALLNFGMLSLSGMHLTSIPKELGQLSNIRILHLDLKGLMVSAEDVANLFHAESEIVESGKKTSRRIFFG